MEADISEGRRAGLPWGVRLGAKSNKPGFRLGLRSLARLEAEELVGLTLDGVVFDGATPTESFGELVCATTIPLLRMPILPSHPRDCMNRGC